MNKVIAVIIINILTTSVACAYGDFYKGSKRGWFWFEQQGQIKSKKEQDTNQKSNTKSTATEELNQFREELDEAKAEMIMRPSVDNTRKFIRYQNEMFAKADVVTTNWQDALLVEPSLNIGRDIPISQAGEKIRNRAEVESNKELVKSFAKKFHLLFFYKSGCIYCSNFEEVLDVFVNRYAFKVTAVTASSAKSVKFPTAVRPDLIEKYGVDFFPSVFAYSEELGVIVPISSGFLAIDELEKQAVFVANKLKERL